MQREREREREGGKEREKCVHRMMGVGVRTPFLLLGHEKCQAHHPGQAGLCVCSEIDT